MYRIFFVLILLLFSVYLQSQNAVTDSLGRTYFYHENGQVSSFGYLEDGKPNGYWQTFHENGVIKSEGLRTHFLLDSMWVFYNEMGNKILEINYKEGLKNGLQNTYKEDEVISEMFENDVKNGLTTHYFKNGSVKKTIPFEKGRENGIAREFDAEGTIIMLIEYRNGSFVRREHINRKDRNNNKQGVWKWFYEDGAVQSEGFYVNNLKNGFFKEYFPDGSLKSILKYVNDEIQQEVPELTKFDIKRDYYPNGRERVVGSYLNGIPEGIRREYDEEGKIVKSYIFSNGVIIGEGIVDENGFKQGYWKEYFFNGVLKAEGHYRNNNKTGVWKFYEDNEKVKQTGKFNNNGFQIGEWKWFHNDGSLKRIENYGNGTLDGLTEEYDTTGQLITKGLYEDGFEEGFWFYITSGYKQEGNYNSGRKNGEWKHYYPDGTIKFKGTYLDDFPNGKHFYYWENGRLKEEQNYIMGKADGIWRKYTPEGLLFIYIDYKRGIEYSYDGVVIRPIILE